MTAFLHQPELDRILELGPDAPMASVVALLGELAATVHVQSLEIEMLRRRSCHHGPAA